MGRVVTSEQIGRLENERQFKQRVFNLFKEFNGYVDLGVSTQTGGAGANTYTGNVRGQWANVTAPVAANTEFAVTHSLVDGQGAPVVPSFYFWISDVACQIYQLPNTGTAWTTTQIFLKCSAGSANLRIFVL